MSSNTLLVKVVTSYSVWAVEEPPLLTRYQSHWIFQAMKTVLSFSMSRSSKDLYHCRYWIRGASHWIVSKCIPNKTHCSLNFCLQSHHTPATSRTVQARFPLNTNQGFTEASFFLQALIHSPLKFWKVIFLLNNNESQNLHALICPRLWSIVAMDSGEWARSLNERLLSLKHDCEAVTP